MIRPRSAVRPLLAVAAGVLLAGCESDPGTPAALDAALRGAGSLELLALHPEYAGDAAGPGGFHGFRVLGTVDVPAGPGREALLDALDRAVAENDSEAASCFDPRHGLRARTGTTARDVLICFECLQMKWYEGGEKRPGELLSEAARPAFDAALRAGGVTPAD